MKNFISNKKVMNKSFHSVSPFFVHLKKHHCPECDELLTVKIVSRVVNSKSPEAKNFKFHYDEISLRGDVEFFYEVFHCTRCNKEFSVTYMIDFEREKKKALKSR